MGKVRKQIETGDKMANPKCIPRVANCVDCGKEIVKTNGSHVRCTECAAVRQKELRKESYLRQKYRRTHGTATKTIETTVTFGGLRVEKFESFLDAVRHADALGMSYGHYMAMSTIEKEKALRTLQNKKRPRRRR